MRDWYSYAVGILGLAVLMIVHECGHFFVARAFGMRVTKFSIGFGPTFFKIVPKDGYFWFTTAADLSSFRPTSAWEVLSHSLASTATRNAIGIALAVVMLAFLMMITRRKAMSQVVGFLSMENGLFLGAMCATYGMPMIVELGVALDVLVAMLVLGVFFFQIREQFDSLDLHHLESLKEEQ